MIIRRLTLVALALSTLAFAGCAPADSAPDPLPTVSEQPTQSPTPSPTPTAPAVSIPTDCRDLVSADVYASTFSDTPLNDPALGYPGPLGAVEPFAPTAGATASEILFSAIQLHCIWRYPEADITYLEATVATVDASVAAQYLAELPAQGYACRQVHDGDWCQLIKPNDMYPVNEGYTEFLRGNVHIFVGQANFPTNDLLGSIVDRLWG